MENKKLKFNFIETREKVLKKCPHMSNIKDAKVFCENIPTSVDLTINEILVKCKIANGKRIFSNKWDLINFEYKSTIEIDDRLEEVYEKVYGNLKGRPKGTKGAYKKAEDKTKKVTFSLYDSDEELLRKIIKLLRQGISPLDVTKALESQLNVKM